MPADEHLEGTVGGQKFSLQTANLIPILLIVLVGAILYYQIVVQQRNIGAAIQTLKGEHQAMSARMTLLGHALRVVNWNQGRPAAERAPIDLPPEWFEEYRRTLEPARRTTPVTPPLPP